VKPGSRAYRRPGRRWPVCVAVAASLGAPAVRADQWTLESSVQGGLEINDNVSLVPNPSGTAYTLSLSNTLAAARNVENASTRLDAVVSALDQRGGGATSRVDGRLAFSHALTLPRGSVSLGATAAQDFNSDVLSADVTVGRGRRRSLGLTAGGSYRPTERLSASVQGSLGSTGYGKDVTQASDYRNGSVNASASYLVSEIESVSLQASRSRYRTVSGSTRSTSDSLDLQYSRSLSERASASLSLGRYRDDTLNTVFGLACPLPVSFCSSGLVPYFVASRVVQTPRRGVDLGASLSYQVDEVSALSLSAGRRKSAGSYSLQFNERDSLVVNAARQVGPSGVGTEVSSQTVSITGAFGLTPTLNAAASLAQSRASVDEGAGASRQPVQTALSVTLSKEFTRDASVQVGWRHTRAKELADGGNARSNSFNIAFKLTWARLEAGR
jgi:hypothetical protein